MVRSLAARRTSPFARRALAVVTLAVFSTPLLTMTERDAAGQTVGGFEIDGNTTHETAQDWNDLSAREVSTDIDNLTIAGQDLDLPGQQPRVQRRRHMAGLEVRRRQRGGQDRLRPVRRVHQDRAGRRRRPPVPVLRVRPRMQARAPTTTRSSSTSSSRPPRTTRTRVRSQGDIRVILDDQGNGNITLTRARGGLYVWVDPDQSAGGVGVDTNQDGDWVRDLTAGDYFATSNADTTLTSLPSWWASQNAPGGQIGPDQFIEAGLDLTDFGAALGCPSQGFTAANARSITGTGAGGLIDYIPFMSISIPSTCSSIPIEKRVRNADGSSGALLGGATFTISPDPAPGPGGRLARCHRQRRERRRPGGRQDPDQPGQARHLLDRRDDRARRLHQGPDSENVTAPEAGARTGHQVFLNGLGQVAGTRPTRRTGNRSPARRSRSRPRPVLLPAAPWNLGTNPISVTDNAGRDTDPANGEFLSPGLPTGTYQLKETAAPSGYILDPTATTFTVAAATTGDSAYATFSTRASRAA